MSFRHLLKINVLKNGKLLFSNVKSYNTLDQRKFSILGGPRKFSVLDGPMKSPIMGESVKFIGAGKSLAKNVKNFSTSRQSFLRVTILGAAGSVGQPLCLLLKYSPDISVIHLYDIAKHNCGVATDLSHIETLSCIAGFTGPDQLCNAIRGADIIICVAGIPRKPGMNRDDLFNTNAPIIKCLADCSAKCAPEAYFLLLSDPLNSTLPIAGQIYKMNCVRTDRLFGITTLDVCRANKFLADIKCLDPADVNVPVICGNSCPTIVPVLSQASPCVCWCCDERYRLACRIQQAGTEVIKTRGVSATLSSAYAVARLTFSLIRALKGECIVECLMCQSCACPQVEWFAGPVQLGKCGIEKHLGIPPLDECERSLLTKGLLQLMCDIDRGYKFACACCKC